jgi:hypothetical protein
MSDLMVDAVLGPIAARAVAALQYPAPESQFVDRMREAFNMTANQESRR